MHGTVSVSVLFLAVCLLVNFCIPAAGSTVNETESSFNSFSSFDYAEVFGSTPEKYDVSDDFLSKEDSGLVLYRQPFSRPAVEWFLTQVTGNREVAQAILENADKNDIPLTLAFSLAYVESKYKPAAVNSNSNATIDRGLFQLNSNSFPKLTEAEFFDPNVSAKYGMIHLRWCMDLSGNEVTALAMYNAGTTRVKANKTPQHTLNYVGKIQKYRALLDEKFSSEIIAFYGNSTNALAMSKISGAKNN
ncbi:MAG: transglycosylase SLT domain-containing protein [Treponema sp.]|nr:transglycosylase SLT domain-containing protein [Treponema sp.]